jgi:hypothetical protein
MTLPTPKYYWNFNETSGTTAVDSVGGAVIALDRASWVPGKEGNAIRFNRNDGAKLATTSLSEIPPPWTIAFWVMREEDCDGAAIFSSSHYGLKLEQWENTHQVGFTKYTINNITGYDPSFDYTAPLKQWVHLALVMGTDNKLRRYVNGMGSDVREVQEPINLGLRWLGSTHGYTEFASAIFDEIQVFDQALTDEQVGELAGVIFEVDLTTGKAGWNLVSAPPNGGYTLGAAPVVTPHPAWTVPLEDGAQWLGNIAGNAAIGEYVYELPFRLGAVVSSSDGQMTVRADEYGTIWLNDTQIGDLPEGIASWFNGSSGAVVQLASYAHLLRPGENKLTVKVTNPSHPGTTVDIDGNPTGLLVTGSLKVK